MLVAEPRSTRSDQHYMCLDLLRATFEDSAASGAVAAIGVTLLEIWATGGLLQADSAAVPGSALSLSHSNGNAPGIVKSCVKDQYGYLIEFAIDSALTDGEKDWFPGSYRPPYLLPPPQ